jgi:ribonuclease HI
MSEPQFHEINFYTDGACSGNHRPDEKGTMGAGIVGVAGKLYREWSIPLGPGTNQQAELHAIREALLKVRDRPHTVVRIHTDSAYAIGLLARGWKPKANQELVAAVRALANECASFEMVKVAGHAGHLENERADELAVAASAGRPPRPGAKDTAAPTPLDYTA